MPLYLGIDTSNYTTSAAVYCSETGEVSHRKKLLPVKQGSLGLKQSDAVFAHVKQLPQLVEELLFDVGEHPPLAGVGVSVRPRDVEGSYMPCFLVGDLAAQTASAVCHIPKYSFSHQAGHIAAALYSAGRLDLLGKEFIAFHFSGGTTEYVHVLPHKEQVFATAIVGQSLDLKCGQAIDRVGKMLGLPFPAGRELDRLSLECGKSYTIKPTFKGNSCCVSGIENQCQKLLSQGAPPQEVARYCIEAVYAIVEQMAQNSQSQFPGLPMVFSGGVMSNTIIRQRITQKYGAAFAQPEFSADNAAGIAVLAWVRGNGYEK